MTTLSIGIASLTLMLASTACAARARQAPQAWDMTGVVVCAGESELQVRHKTGRVIAFTLDEQTVYVSDEGATSWRSLYTGRRVRVEVDSLDSVQRARRVYVFGGGAR